MIKDSICGDALIFHREVGLKHWLTASDLLVGHTVVSIVVRFTTQSMSPVAGPSCAHEALVVGLVAHLSSGLKALPTTEGSHVHRVVSHGDQL